MDEGEIRGLGFTDDDENDRYEKKDEIRYEENFGQFDRKRMREPLTSKLFCGSCFLYVRD